MNPEEESFCLQQMIELDLHDHVEAVSTIVDKAMKESNIDKNLSKVRFFYCGCSCPGIVSWGFDSLVVGCMSCPLFPHHVSLPLGNPLGVCSSLFTRRKDFVFCYARMMIP